MRGGTCEFIASSAEKKNSVQVHLQRRAMFGNKHFSHLDSCGSRTLALSGVSFVVIAEQVCCYGRGYNGDEDIFTLHSQAAFCLTSQTVIEAFFPKTAFAP